MEKEQLMLGSYLVAFLDVLGQRETFRQLQLPKTREEYTKVEGALKDTVGFVLGLRRVFRKNFESFKAGLVSIPGVEKAISTPDFMGFSDSFIAFVSLRNDDEHLTPNIRIYSTLNAACVVMLTSLASRHSLRGGIDIGLAAEMCPGEIYGTALERAYLLESCHADYPRVLIGDDLWNYLSLGLNEFGKLTTPTAQLLGKVIRKDMEFITVDTTDGRRILDYLGPGIVSISSDQTKTVVKSAYQFVLEQHEHWLSNGDGKLSGRYASLRRYFESRLPLWGLAASIS
jgi:hypothetical protein